MKTENNWIKTEAVLVRKIENNVTLLFIDDQSPKLQEFFEEYMKMEGAKPLEIKINTDYEVEF